LHNPCRPEFPDCHIALPASCRLGPGSGDSLTSHYARRILANSPSCHRCRPPVPVAV
jgi:hypothetical protein